MPRQVNPNNEADEHKQTKKPLSRGQAEHPYPQESDSNLQWHIAHFCSGMNKTWRLVRSLFGWWKHDRIIATLMRVITLVAIVYALFSFGLQSSVERTPRPVRGQFLVFFGSARATNYYVDASTGNDRFDCTVAVFTSGTTGPCLTITRAEAVSAIGDTINIAAGTYRLSTSNRSTAGWITAKANQAFVGPSCTPTVGPTKCTAVVSGGTVIGPSATGPDRQGDWSVAGQTQQARLNAYLCDTGWDGCNYPEDVFYDGVPLQHIKSASRPTLVSGQFWFDYTNHIIYFHDIPSGHTVETSVLETMFNPNGVNGVTLQNLTIEEFAAPTQLGGIDPAFGSNASPNTSINWKIQNCYLTLNHGEGIRAAFGEQILNNVVDTNGQVGLGGGTNSVIPSRILVQGNTVTNNNYAHVHPGFGAGGIKYGYTTGAVIKNNIVNNNIGHGIHFDVGSANPLIDGNTVTGNSDAGTGGGSLGIQFEIGLVGAVIRNNIIQNNGLGGAGPNYNLAAGGDSTGTLMYCNVIEIGASAHQQGAAIIASNRGKNTVQPGLGNYLVSINNNFHHNTQIWDTGAAGTSGYVQSDTVNQPNFFTNNVVPDYNEYHMSDTNLTVLRYDNNNSGRNTPKTFAQVQAQGAEAHGSVDTINTSGFPAVSLTSPADNTQIMDAAPISVTASDRSGITKVEFYLDWVLVGTVNNPGPYNFTLNTGSQGSHVVAAKAYATSGVHACNAVTLVYLEALPVAGNTF
jgi:parallel beta-helix repeat protein